MINALSVELRNQIWLMYLRKSRQDDPNETVEEVLAKHESILQEWAKRELGYEIPEDCIYREVVSGESIEDRTEIKKVLSRIEAPNVVGIIVVEPQRLSRGDLIDCGTLISTLQYTKTLVATPMMTYSMENKMERRFFQDELMRGRDYLEYVKEILSRGRIASIKKGCYIGSKPPYGYDKVSIGKDKTLVPNEDADIVRLIFNLYVNDRMTYQQVANRLGQLGVKPKDATHWSKQTIRAILRNYHYIGKVYYSRRKDVTMVENGERITRRMFQPLEDVIMAEGKHPAIIDRELFDAAQEIMNNNPRLWTDRELKNPFASILKCAKCGKTIVHHPYHHALDRLECRTKPMCFKSAKVEDVMAAVIAALEHSELPKLKAHLKGGDGDSLAIQRKQLRRLEAQMEEYRMQEETQYELLETRKYTQEVFDKRNAALRERMAECEKKIASARQSLPKSIDYQERIVSLESAIAGLKDPAVSPKEKNRLLKSVVERIEMYTEEGEVRGETRIHLKVFMNI